jgi:hypothetical protein
LASGGLDECDREWGSERSGRLRPKLSAEEWLTRSRAAPVLSDAKRRFGYCILEAQAPLRNYVASVRLRPVTSDDSCFMEWRASFDPPPQERVRLERFVREEIIEAGFAAR